MHGYLVVLVAVTAYCLGRLVTRHRIKSHAIADIVIDRSDPDGTHIFLELNGVTPEYISKQDLVTFKVVNKNYISQ